ncbi:tRNA nucleotidyltransferase, A-adding [hydrothermal vent metagenome]|uniref:tRNA nucleotidyltransferase, A-adding n=1 Tax=hydrothermal vent metagenome TaxID=652676 RepID=A0A3B0TG65_9ZZZZ
MKNYLLNYDLTFKRLINSVKKAADQRNVSAYLAGGIVRDILLNRASEDLDIVLEDDVIEIGKSLAKEWNAVFTYYPEFKTATLKTKNNFRVDLATARKETYASPGALPRISAATLKDDLFRRDFSINAMAICINQKEEGCLIDPFGGLLDLNNKKIKILHPKSFIDDPTRILRAVRFEQRFGYRMERKTLELLKKAVKGKRINNVSSDRLYAELKKMLKEKHIVECLKRLNQLQISKFFMGKGIFDIRYINKIQKRKREYSSLKCVWFYNLLALVEGFDSKKLSKFVVNFSFSKREKKVFQECQDISKLLKKLGGLKVCRSDIYGYLEKLDEKLIVYLNLRSSVRSVCQRIDRYLKIDRFVYLKITGDDLKKIGFKSGAKMGQILSKVFEEKIEGKVSTKKDELVLAKSFMVK